MLRLLMLESLVLDQQERVQRIDQRLHPTMTVPPPMPEPPPLPMPEPPPPPTPEELEPMPDPVEEIELRLGLRTLPPSSSRSVA